MTTAEDYLRPRGDPRVAQTRELVLKAARDLLLSEGQDSVTPTRLTEITGISRSTIYRHWNDPGEIIFEATATDSQRAPFTPQGDVRKDLTAYLKALRDMLEGDQGSLLATQIDRSEHDEAASDTMERIAVGRRDLIRRLAQHPSEDFTTAHALLVGPLVFQRYLAREKISDELITEVVAAYMATFQLR